MVRLFKVGGRRWWGGLPVEAVEQGGGGGSDTDLTSHLWPGVVVAGFSGALGPVVNVFLCVK